MDNLDLSVSAGLMVEAIEREASSVFSTVPVRRQENLPQSATLPDPIPLEA
jgi:hypothetical protein